MFLKVFREDIIEGLQKSANIIPAKTGAAFLRTIWLKVEDKSLKIMSTDSNIEFCGMYDAEIIEEGLVGVQGRSFYELIKKLPPGKIELKVEEGGKTLVLKQGSRKYKLPTNEQSWFQDFSAFPEESSVFWSGDFLHEIIEKIAFCISDEDSMEAIACLNLAASEGQETLEACGLNGHQFSIFRFLQDDLKAKLPEKGILIQKKYIAELRKWLTSDEIELNIGDKRLFFRTGDKRETFSLPLSFHQYPDYLTFMSKIKGEVSSLSVDRLEMIDALERIAIFNTDNNRCVYFAFKGETINLWSQGQETGKASETLDVEFDGDMDKISFPTKDLIDVLNHFSSDKVVLKLTGTEGPCGIEGEDDPDYLVIIMPMKIVEETYYSEENEDTDA